MHIANPLPVVNLLPESTRPAQPEKMEIFFSTKKKDLEKKVLELRKLAHKRNDLQLVELGVNDFVLTLPTTE